VNSPGDLLRGLLAYELFGYSFRELGAWSLLSGLANISEAAWRKHLRRAVRWLDWMLRRKLAISTTQVPWLHAKGRHRVILVDGTHLRCLGRHGQVWRIHTADDLLAGQLTEVEVTDCSIGEDWRRFQLQEGDLVESRLHQRFSPTYCSSVQSRAPSGRALFAHHLAPGF
jgi:hypothetical protein